jgi:DNA polymerase I
LYVICDVEANGLKPTEIHLIVCKEVHSGNVRVFRPSSCHDDYDRFAEYARDIDCYIGHYFLGYDLNVLTRLVPGCAIPPSNVVDTLVVSRLLDYNRDGGHSLEAWGRTLGIEKKGVDITDWSVYTKDMELRCLSDVEINYALYRYFEGYIHSPLWKDALRLEHDMQVICNELHDNGFAFNLDKAKELMHNVTVELESLDTDIMRCFPPKTKLVREITPRATKHGTIHRGDFRWVRDGDLSPYSVGSPFSLIEWQEFNPRSPTQIVERLNAAGWKPFEKTKGHIAADRARDKDKLKHFRVFGWKVSEANLATLPETAPEGTRKLARRILIESRRSDLEEWINVYQPDGRIHGVFNPIGAWTGRMSHNSPNMANIPTGKSAYSSEMRALWTVGNERLLVGVDAEGIQLRILAHYMNDERFTFGVTKGNKTDGTDPHTLNKHALGEVCKSRDDAKTFIYAWLLGAGLGKVSQILGCSREEAEEANENFLKYYPGLSRLKKEVIPADAERGYFRGIDGRFVQVASEHYVLAGYLQNGESVVMKRACRMWKEKLNRERIPYWLVNFVHDEWQTETVNDLDTAIYVAETQANAIKQVGLDLGLNCPLAGSFKRDDGTFTIGQNWYETH